MRWVFSKYLIDHVVYIKCWHCTFVGLLWCCNSVIFLILDSQRLRVLDKTKFLLPFPQHTCTLFLLIQRPDRYMDMFS